MSIIKKYAAKLAIQKGAFSRMHAYKNILLPVDLSQASPRLTGHVEKFASSPDCVVHLLYVVRQLPHLEFLYFIPEPSAGIEDRIIEEAQKRLCEFRDGYLPDKMQTTIEVKPGDAAEQIAAYAGARDIDLIVMGTHGRKGLDKVVFGSVADRVMIASPVPIYLTNPYRCRQRGLKRLLWPIDFSEASDKMVAHAKKLMALFNLELHLLFVSRDLGHYSAIHVPPQSICTLSAEMLAGARRRIGDFKYEYFTDADDVYIDVVSGDVAEQILKYAGAMDIDLILIGTHGRKGLNKIIFGSVAERVIKTSPVPVFVVNPYRSMT